MKSTNVDSALRAYWYPVVREDLLGQEPIRVEICGEAVAVVRLDGRPAAMIDRCPHRDARLSDGTVVDGCLQCPYHGWLFDADGACTLIPALGPESAAVTRTPATSLATRVEHGLVWVALEEPRSELIEIPEWGDPELGVAWLPVVTIEAGAAQFVDSEPITMAAADVLAVSRTAPDAEIVVVHMESFNHCLLSRSELTAALAAAGLLGRVSVPCDGDALTFPRT